MSYDHHQVVGKVKGPQKTFPFFVNNSINKGLCMYSKQLEMK